MDSEAHSTQRHISLSPSPQLRASLKFRQACKSDPVRSGAIFKQSAEAKKEQPPGGSRSERKEEIRTLFETLCRESPAPRALSGRHSDRSRDQVRLLMPPPKAVSIQSQPCLEGQRLLVDANHSKSLPQEASQERRALGASTQEGQSVVMESESGRAERVAAISQGLETPEKQDMASHAMSELQTHASEETDPGHSGQLPDDNELPAEGGIPEAGDDGTPCKKSEAPGGGAQRVSLEAEIRTEEEEAKADGEGGPQGRTEGAEGSVPSQKREQSALGELGSRQEGSKKAGARDGNEQRSPPQNMAETQRRRRAYKILRDLSSPSLSPMILAPIVPQGDTIDSQTGVKFTKRGRARVPPIAFWKNEGLEKDQAVGVAPSPLKQTPPAKKIQSPKATAARLKATAQPSRDESLCRRYDGKGWYCPSPHAPGKLMCEFHWKQARKRVERAQLKARRRSAKRAKKAKGQGIVAEPGGNETSKAEYAAGKKGSDVSEGGGSDARASRKRQHETREAARKGDVSDEGLDLDARAARKQRREMRRVGKDGASESEEDEAEGHSFLLAALLNVEVDDSYKEPANEQVTRVPDDPMDDSARASKAVLNGEVFEEGNEASSKKEDGMVSSGGDGLNNFPPASDLGERGGTAAPEGLERAAVENGEEGHVADLQPSMRTVSKQAEEMTYDPKQSRADMEEAMLVESLLGGEQNEPRQASDTANSLGVGQEETLADGGSLAEKALVEKRIVALRAALEAEEKRLRRLSQQGSPSTQQLTPAAQAGSTLPE